MELSPIITLDLNDAVLVKRLKAKVREYKERLAHQDPYKAPEHYIGTTYRLRVLEELLKEGKVVTWDLSVKMAKEDVVYRNKFNNACGVIQDYVETGGANNIGGILPPA